MLFPTPRAPWPQRSRRPSAPAFHTTALLLALLAQAAHSQDATSTDPAVAAASAPEVFEPQESTPPREQIQGRIAELEKATEIDEALRTARIDQLRVLLGHLDARQRHTERARAHRDAIATAPAETARIREELAAGVEVDPLDPLVDDPNTDADALQQRLTTAQADLSALRARRGELERQLADRNNRPEQARAELQTARTALQTLEPELARPAPAAEAPEADRVARWILLARQQARLAEVQALEQELLSQPARVELLTARRDLTRLQVLRGEEAVSRLEGRVSALRQEEAARARQEAERLQREALGKHPLIRTLTDEIATISREAEELRPQIDTLRRQRDEVASRLERVTADFDEARSILEWGLAASQGVLLLEHRRSLPDPEALRLRAAQGTAQLEKRQELRRIERELLEYVDPRRQLDLLLEDESAITLTGQERENLRRELELLLKSKHTLLEQKARALREYQTAAKDLQGQEQKRYELVRDFVAVLDENLLWIRDAAPIDGSLFEQLFTDTAWILDPSLWAKPGRFLRTDFEHAYPLYALVAVAFLGLLAMRRRMRRTLDDIAARVDRVREDGISLTIGALALHLGLALPLPLPLGFLAWRLSQSSGENLEIQAIGFAFLAAFALAFVVYFLRTLFRESGVATRHFRWGDRARKIVRQRVVWFLIVGLPCTFVVTLTQFMPTSAQAGYPAHPDVRYGLGRVAFIVLMAGVAVVAWFLLHPERGLVSGRLSTTRSAWLKRSRPIWMPLGILVPVTLGVVAALGYYYAALQLELRLNQTVLILLGAVFLHAFLLRWLTVSQRRLSLKVAMEKRAALMKSRESEDDEIVSTESIIGSLDTVDVAEIKGQTQDLLRISLGILVIVALWFAWVDILPALGILDDVELWAHQVPDPEGGPDLTDWITLGDLALAALILAVTVTAARNMPGFLEIAVLQRLNLEAGARYAIRTLLLYAIVSTGVVVAFNSIGVDWSSVQWLVAALTVGLGFGLQEIFANFVSGLIILLERPVRVGDTVTVGSVSGVVSRIRMRATTITDWNRRELVVPNKGFITGEIINWSLSDPILRIDFVVGIAYGSNTALAQRTMLEACTEHPLVLEHPEPNVFFTAFGESSLDFEVRAFVSETTNTGRTRILHELHMAIDRACREQGIEIAFPQRDLHIRSSDIPLGGYPPRAQGAAPDEPRE